MNQYRLLLVDDYESLLAVMKIFFQRQGYDVTLAANGAKAVECAASVDAIIMDTEMRPGMFGFEACKQIRAQPFGKHLVIIGTSSAEGYIDKKGKDFDYHNAWMDAGADAFVLKDPARSFEVYGDMSRMIQNFFETRNRRV